MKIFVKPLLALPLLFLFVSCGGDKPMVDDIKVNPHYVDSDLYVSMSANLSIGSVTLPHASFPIIEPKTFEEIGQVTMTSQLAGENLLEVDLNVSAIANVQGESARLPNGGLLPLIGDNQVIVIPIAKNVEVYLALSDGTAAMGVSIPFKTLDAVGANVGTSSLFPMFNINQVVGAAGLYTSRTPGQNGFGLFADISAVLDPIMFVDLGLRTDIQAQQAGLDYNSIKPSDRVESKINREMYYLDRRKARLELN